MDKNNAAELTPDLYFLIQKLFSSGLLKKTLKVFNEELEENKIFPKRIDWKGNEHERTVEDMIKQFPNVRPDYLLYLCFQASNPSNANIAGSSRNNKDVCSFLSFRPRVCNENGIFTNFRQYFNYVTRKNGMPIHKLNAPFNIVNCLRGREASGSFSRQRAITPRLYNALQIQRITIGHLSAVYCLLFDHSGRYIITGADDLLIKLWSAHTGRLIFSFRGASSEITDIAINSENTLLAAGSIDRILRVWSLQNGAPIAVLTGHTGMITSVNFCPTSSWGVRYLITTSTDGSIAFWTYTCDSGGKVEFRGMPILYQEKIRPGQAQMICSSFSPGGTFLATGSADHHVRVYNMKGDEGPQRILEMEVHSDRVDSIQWANSGLRFLSGSKDGMAIIWWFERQQWKSVHLDMTTKLSNAKNVPDTVDPKKLKVTMVCWNKSNEWVATAISDYTIKIWSGATGALDKVLSGHTDEIYVLEAHPHDNDVMLSAGHDGQLFVWDVFKGEIVYRYLNSIEGQGYGSLFDVKWSPDGCGIAGSDSHGHILTFGFGHGSPYFEQLPKELFFHTDYRPLVRDSNHYVLDEQTQIPPHLMPPPFLVDMDGNPYPPMLQRLVPGREHCNVEQLVPNIVIGHEGTQEVIQDIPRNLPMGLQEIDNRDEENIRVAGSSLRQARRTRDVERIRHSTGDWQTDPNMEWKKNVLMETLKKCVLDRSREIRECMKDSEMEEYQRQLRQRPHMISINTSHNIKRKEEERKKKKNVKYATRSLRAQYEYKDDHMESSGNDNDSESSGYSDWVAEEGIDRPKRTKRRPKMSLSDQDEDDDEDEEEEDDDDYDVESPRSSKENHSAPRSSRENGVNKVVRSAAQPPKAAVASTSGAPRASKLKVSEKYRLSEWLSETRPRKSPYYPQLGDEVVYFVQGHRLYLDAVRMKNVYEISTKDLPWTKMTIRDHEFAKVIGIQYEIKPPRLCCLKLHLLDEEGRFTGQVFTVKYHDMPDVLDFFVLKQLHCTAMSRNWQNGDKFRCMIDDEWWIGHIVNKSPASDVYPNSSFMCYEIVWNNGEQERMSPWDMEPLDLERLPEDETQSVPVLDHELTSILYKSVPEDWPGADQQSGFGPIVEGLTKVMQLAIAEPFLVPVDINVYPSYAFVIEYPVDLSTIKARFENNFYRRLTAAQFDVRYLSTNAEKFNEKHSIIVKQARIVTELCLRIVKNSTQLFDVTAVYHQLMDAYDSSDTEDEVEAAPSSSRTLRTLPNRNLKEAIEWKVEARNLMDALWDCEDSVPFRVPVNALKYPEYSQIVRNPMDLGTVKENLANDVYNIPQQFCADMRLIFRNSRLFNTNKRSRIYVMTVRLSAIFEEQMKKIISNWKCAKRSNGRKLSNSSSSSDNSDVTVTTSSSEEENEAKREDEEVIVDVTTSNVPETRNGLQSDADSSDDDLPLKAFSRANTESDSTSRSVEKFARNCKKKADSEDEYHPTAETSQGRKGSGTKARKRPRYRVTSSDEPEEDSSSEEDDSEENSRMSSLRTRPARRKVKKELFYMSESEESVARSSKRRKAKKEEDSDDDSEVRSSRSEEPADGTFISSVSSRGRVRKFTERAKALFKKR